MVESVKIFVNILVEIVVNIVIKIIVKIAVNSVVNIIFISVVIIVVNIVVKIDNIVFIFKIASPSAPIVLIFIGPRSDHSLPMSLTHSLTNWRTCWGLNELT